MQKNLYTFYKQKKEINAVIKKCLSLVDYAWIQHVIQEKQTASKVLKGIYRLTGELSTHEQFWE
ncbi:hypothetical protein GCM10020331_101170 [Ectobacillus funiculus]